MNAEGTHIADTLVKYVPNIQVKAVRVSHDTKFKHSPENIAIRKLGAREGMIDSDSWSIVHG